MHQSRNFYLTTGKICPCKMCVLDPLLEKLSFPAPNDKDNIIINLRLLDRTHNPKHERESGYHSNVITLEIPDHCKTIIDEIGYKRRQELEERDNIVFNIPFDEKFPVFCEKFEKIIKEWFPKYDIKTFFNYSKIGDDGYIGIHIFDASIREFTLSDKNKDNLISAEDTLYNLFNDISLRVVHHPLDRNIVITILVLCSPDFPNLKHIIDYR